MAAVTICSDFRAQEEEICHCFHLLPLYLSWSDGTGCHDISFLILSFKPAFSFSSFTFIKNLFSSSSLSAIRVSSAYLKLLIFLSEILIPACNSSSPAFHMLYSTYNLNKQGDNIQPCHTPFSILNQSVLHKVLTVASWPTYRFLRRQVRSSGIPISLRVFHIFFMIHTVKGFSIVNETEVDIFLECPCFFCDPANVANLIFGSSVFSKPSLFIWKFSVHVLLKPSLKDFEHNLINMESECNYQLVWTFFSIAFLEIGMKIDLFQFHGCCWVFQICRHIECNTLIASSFRILNSSVGIPSPPLALLAAVFPMAHLNSQ